MAKKTIKGLEQELKYQMEEKDRWWRKHDELVKENRQENNRIIGSLRDDNYNLVSQVKNLLEIIRWQVNPETAKAPFQVTKDQITENELRVNRDF